MKCAECVSDGKTSKVYQGYGVTMPMGGPQFFWDEKGVQHIHDGDKTSWNYTCSEGHSFSVPVERSCPARGCSWGRRASENKESRA